MKKLMIIGAGKFQVPLIEQARQMNINTIVVSPDGNYPGLKIADKVYFLDVREKDAILEIAKAEKIDGVTTDQTDIAVRTVAYIAEKMGLPGIGYETAILFTDKIRMREESAKLGLPTIRFKKVVSCNEAEDFFNELGKSVIIKPADNQGSRGVFLIHTLEELRREFEQSRAFSATKQVIVEEYIQGREFEVDSILFDYEEKTLMYADTDLYDIPDVFASKTRLYPSVADAESIAKLLKLNHDTITGFGLKQGLTHSEYIQSEDGEIYLIEAAARGGGSYISSHIGELQTGVNTSEFLVKLALGELDKLPDFKGNKCHCGYVTFYMPEGVLVDKGTCEEVKNYDFVEKEELDSLYVGKKFGSFSDKTARNVIVVKANSREELLKHIDTIRKNLIIKVETPDGIKGPIWE